MHKRPYRGVFSIPVTPFDELGALDEAGLAQVVEFTISAGAHGLVAPVNASEFSALSDAERLRVVDIVSRANKGRLPFVAGVSGVSLEVARGFAAHAADCGADALIAMPPYVRKPHTDEVRRYFDGLAGETDLPIFLQNYPLPVGVPMSAGFMAAMVREVPTICYIKEEVPPVTHTVTADIEACGDAVEGVFGGAAGKYMIDEMRRGSAGTMPACDVTDLDAAVWESHQSGDFEGARSAFNRLLPLLNFESLYGVNAYKEVLRRRGVIRSAYVRSQTARPLDVSDRAELDAILGELQDLFKVQS